MFEKDRCKDYASTDKLRRNETFTGGLADGLCCLNGKKTYTQYYTASLPFHTQVKLADVEDILSENYDLLTEHWTKK